MKKDKAKRKSGAYPRYIAKVDTYNGKQEDKTKIKEETCRLEERATVKTYQKAMRDIWWVNREGVRNRYEELKVKFEDVSNSREGQMFRGEK